MITRPTEAFGDGLDVPEGSLPGSGDEEPNGLIDPAQRRHVDGLPTHRAYKDNHEPRGDDEWRRLMA